MEAGIQSGDLRVDTDVEMSGFMLDALMDRFLQAYCVPFLDAGASIYKAPADELERKADEFIKLLGMGWAPAAVVRRTGKRTGPARH